LENNQQWTPLHGLVLAGGDSSRMGFDKGLIPYHGMPHREYLLQILSRFTVQSFLSCRPGQIIDGDLPVIEDSFTDLGPLGGLLSAFKFDETCAWLVVACDFPLLDESAILELTEVRNPEVYATAFYDARSALPEPWITIVEPKLYPVLLEKIARGKTSLRGALQDYPISLVTPTRPEILLNVNSRQDFEEIISEFPQLPYPPIWR